MLEQNMTGILVIEENNMGLMIKRDKIAIQAGTRGSFCRFAYPKTAHQLMLILPVLLVLLIMYLHVMVIQPIPIKNAGLVPVHFPSLFLTNATLEIGITQEIPEKTETVNSDSYLFENIFTPSRQLPEY